ncbi:uncharacterized protein SPSK_10925 [Sporothrix schenckii 1099-18]|uniref:Uncharacterized protein n=1 Tax=Sporothrix schenckii 1099-18 TaxID=1397361 RepID=A0A0F2MAI3_SPOSC|nr:uncharacterized protein SPSK_10925 [Sporothrix schenckii 1099-18]KJR85171.1 hypothetical protein SPSK_10925 [Sporothrix schenckii 1099-18]
MKQSNLYAIQLREKKRRNDDDQKMKNEKDKEEKDDDSWVCEVQTPLKNRNVNEREEIHEAVRFAARNSDAHSPADSSPSPLASKRNITHCFMARPRPSLSGNLGHIPRAIVDHVT